MLRATIRSPGEDRDVPVHPTPFSALVPHAKQVREHLAVGRSGILLGQCRESRQVLRVKGRLEKRVAHLQKIVLRVTQHLPAALVHVQIAFLKEIIDKQDSGYRLRNLLKKAVALSRSRAACLWLVTSHMIIRMLSASNGTTRDRRNRLPSRSEAETSRRKAGRNSLCAAPRVRRFPRRPPEVSLTLSAWLVPSRVPSLPRLVPSAHAKRLTRRCARILLGGLGGRNPTPVRVGRKRWL